MYAFPKTLDAARALPHSSFTSITPLVAVWMSNKTPKASTRLWNAFFSGGISFSFQPIILKKVSIGMEVLRNSTSGFQSPQIVATLLIFLVT